MAGLRDTILKRLCYTELVYGRINKKLARSMTNAEIEGFIYEIVKCEQSVIDKTGKNYYVKAIEKGVSITINSYTYRVITADKL